MSHPLHIYVNCACTIGNSNKTQARTLDALRVARTKTSQTYTTIPAYVTHAKPNGFPHKIAQ